MSISQAVTGIEPMSPEVFHTEVLSKSDVITLIGVSFGIRRYAEVTYTTLDCRYDVGILISIQICHHAIATK